MLQQGYPKAESSNNILDRTGDAGRSGKDIARSKS
jgi:hypothetical protein